jgi:hypothetical protein
MKVYFPWKNNLIKLYVDVDTTGANTSNLVFTVFRAVVDKGCFFDFLDEDPDPPELLIVPFFTGANVSTASRHNNIVSGTVDPK